MALCLLVAGAIIAESASSQSKSAEEGANSMIGVLLMLVYVSMSGFAGVYTEKMLKRDTGLSFFMKQMILYFWGSLISGFGVFLTDWYFNVTLFDYLGQLSHRRGFSLVIQGSHGPLSFV